MASIYTSRQLLDPNWIYKSQEQSRQDYRNRLDSLGESAKWFRDWRNRKEEEEKKVRDQNTRRALLGNYSEQGPVEAAAANRFVETGDPSGIMNLENNKMINKAREDEAKKQARLNLTLNRPKFIELKNKYEQQIQSGDYTGAEATKAYMLAMEAETPGLMQGVDFDSYEAAKKKEAEEKVFAEQEKKTIEMAEAQRQKNIANRSADLKQFILSRLPEGTIKDIDEKNEYMDMIDRYSQTGLLTEEDKKELQKYVQGVKTTKQQIQEAQTGAIASDVGEQTKKQREAARLAQSVDNAILNNTPPSQLTAEEKAEMAKRKMKWSNKQWVKYE